MRFGTWFWGCGLTPGRWEPKKVGASYDLPPELQPLARAERREKVTPHFFPDRRKGGFSLTPGLEGGWLCFDSPVEKRRLFPIPEGWDRFADDELLRMCRSARPAPPDRTPTF